VHFRLRYECHLHVERQSYPVKGRGVSLGLDVEASNFLDSRLSDGGEMVVSRADRPLLSLRLLVLIYFRD
jgi:hypothetical protein